MWYQFYLCSVIEMVKSRPTESDSVAESDSVVPITPPRLLCGLLLSCVEVKPQTWCLGVWISSVHKTAELNSAESDSVVSKILLNLTLRSLTQKRQWYRRAWLTASDSVESMRGSNLYSAEPDSVVYMSPPNLLSGVWCSTVMSMIPYTWLCRIWLICGIWL